MSTNSKKNQKELELENRRLYPQNKTPNMKAVLMMGTKGPRAIILEVWA